MVKRRWLWILLAGAGLVGLPPRLPAQFFFSVRSTRHDSSNSSQSVAPKRDPFGERFGLPDGDPEEILTHRLLLREIAEQMKKEGVRPEDLEHLRQHYPDFPKNWDARNLDNLPKSLSNLLKGMPAEDLQKKFGSIDLEALQKYLGKTASDGTDLTPMGTRPAVDGPALGNAKASGPRERANSVPEQPAPSSPEVSVVPATEAQQSPSAGDPLAHRLHDWAQRLQKWAPSLKDSPALNQAIQGLSHYAGGEDERWEKMARAMRNAGERLSQWGGNLALDRLAPAERLRWPRGLARPSMPSFHLPDVGTAIANRTPTDMPRVGLPTGSTDERRPVLVGVAAVLLLGVLAWKMWGRLQGLSSQDGSAAWKPRPWPVEPHAVRTPQELVWAFEHLSVLCLGAAARNWNHRAIAASLGRQNGGGERNGAFAAHQACLSSERRRAADELADLYEHARYAPPSDPLPEEALVAARQDLCLLAGTHVG